MNGWMERGRKIRSGEAKLKKIAQWLLQKIKKIASPTRPPPSTLHPPSSSFSFTSHPIKTSRNRRHLSSACGTKWTTPSKFLGESLENPWRILGESFPKHLRTVPALSQSTRLDGDIGGGASAALRTNKRMSQAQPRRQSRGFEAGADGASDHFLASSSCSTSARQKETKTDGRTDRQKRKERTESIPQAQTKKKKRKKSATDSGANRKDDWNLNTRSNCCSIQQLHSPKFLFFLIIIIIISIYIFIYISSLSLSLSLFPSFIRVVRFNQNADRMLESEFIFPIYLWWW